MEGIKCYMPQSSLNRLQLVTLYTRICFYSFCTGRLTHFTRSDSGCVRQHKPSPNAGARLFIFGVASPLQKLSLLRSLHMKTSLLTNNQLSSLTGKSHRMLY